MGRRRNYSAVGGCIRSSLIAVSIREGMAVSSAPCCERRATRMIEFCRYYFLSDDAVDMLSFEGSDSFLVVKLTGGGAH